MAFSAVAFAILFFGSILLAFVRHPIFGLYAYFLAFYGYPPGRWWGLDLPDLRWSFMAAAATAISLLLRRSTSEKTSWLSNPAAKLLILFTCWIWIQTFWALSPQDHQVFTIMYTKYLVVFYIFYKILTDEKTVTQVFLAHIAGCGYLGWLAFQTAGAGRFEYIGGPNMDGASAFGSQMVTGLIFAGIMLLQTRGAVRIFVFLAIPFILNAIILTQSRGAFVGLLAGGMAALYLCPPKFRRTFYAFGALGVILFSMLAHDAFLERMGTITNAVEQTDMDSSAASRWELIEAQWEMFKAEPVIGVGHRGTVILSPSYLDEKWLSYGGGRSSHNTWMTVLVEQGIIGACFYFALTAWVIVALRRLKRLDQAHDQESLGMLRTAVGAAIASIYVSGLFADFLRLEITIWCLILLVVISRMTKTEVAADDKTQQQATTAN